LFNYKAKATPSKKIYMKDEQKHTIRKKYKVKSEPIRKIEVPNLIDDYYLNLVCWGK